MLHTSDDCIVEVQTRAFVVLCLSAMHHHAVRGRGCPTTLCSRAAPPSVPLGFDEAANYCRALASVATLLIPEEAATYFQGDKGFIAAMEVGGLP